MAPQDQATFTSSDAVCVHELNLSGERGIADDISEHLCTTGRQVPIETAVRKINLALTFLRENTTQKSIIDAIRSDVLYKLRAIWQSAEGSPGCSISDSSPSTDISGSSNSKLNIRLTHAGTGNTEDHEVTLSVGSLNTGALIAAAIQTAMRAESATSQLFSEALGKFKCDYDSTVSSKYYLSCDCTALYDVSVIAASGTDLAPELKLGTGNGGTEPGNVPDQIRVYLPEVQFSPPGDEQSQGARKPQIEGMALKGYGSNTPAGFASSDDTYLASDMDSEEIRVVVVNRMSASPFA